MEYTPLQEILNKYADVVINFALNGGEGIKEKETVFLMVPESAKPLLITLQAAVLKSGAYPVVYFMPNEMQRGFTELSRQYYELANEDQLNFFPEKYMKGLVDQADHLVGILAEADKHDLEGIDSKKIMTRQKAFTPYKNWRFEKEDRGELTWTLALYGTSAMADEVGMSLEEYWNEIIKACYLEEPDPVQKWREVMGEISRVKNKLNELNIEKIRVKSENTDLLVGLGENRRWLGGSGRNIPSFEVFISPDCRMTEGHIYFNQPLYRYGNLIKDVRLEFKEGRVVKAEAKQGEQVLKDMIAVENADKIGEFSLTEGRLSHITKFMAETLYDENAGGEFGNTHLALGSAYKDSYPGDPSKPTKEQWEEWGFNDSVIHTDIISTENRVVTAYLKDKSEKIIYRDGKFVI